MIRKVLLALFFITMNAQENNVVSKLETIDIKFRSRIIIYEETEHFEAQNWSLDANGSNHQQITFDKYND